MTKQELTDWLFRLGLYWGVKVDPVPYGLIEVRPLKDGQLVEEHIAEINPDHEMADWLLTECEGPWDIKLHRPHSKQEAYLMFGRLADAVIFKLML